MHEQISPAVIVVVIIVVILVLIAMWHFIYGQEQKRGPGEGNLVVPEAAQDERGTETRAPSAPEGEQDTGSEEQPAGEEATQTDAAPAED
jgi:cbb3-type cytochrome oxidase subunit 3